jgi:hypothetical protein
LEACCYDDSSQVADELPTELTSGFTMVNLTLVTSLVK